MDLRRKKGKGQLAPILLLLLIVVLAGGTLAYFLSVPSSGQDIGSSSSGSVVPSVLPVTDPQALDPNGVQILSLPISQENLFIPSTPPPIFLQERRQETFCCSTMVPTNMTCRWSLY